MRTKLLTSGTRGRFWLKRWGVRVRVPYWVAVRWMKKNHKEWFEQKERGIGEVPK